MQGAASTTATVQITQTTSTVHLKAHLVRVAILTTVIAISVASTRSATGMAELASIVLKHVRRLCVARALLNIATAIVMGSATWAASPRTAIGITATAATVLRIVLLVLVAIMTGATVNAT
jgi:hypothetical protein